MLPMMISVVIPLFNKKQSIRSTLDSVLSQTYQDYEVIVVDDGSTDDGAEIAKEKLIHSGIDVVFSLIRKENGGVCSARNVGIRAAKGEWIAFLDADDLWEPTFLEEMVRLIIDFPNAGIVGSSYSFLKKGEKELANKPLEDSFRGIVDNRTWDKAHIYCSSAVVCLKRALEEIGLFDERIAYGEDIDVWWRIMLRYPAAYVNKELAVYRLDEDNRAMNRKIPLEKLYINYFEKYSEARKENTAFRHFIDKECMWWLFPYFAENPKDANVRRILKQINLKEYKWSFRFRFMFPHLYTLIKGVR